MTFRSAKNCVLLELLMKHGGNNWCRLGLPTISNRFMSASSSTNPISLEEPNTVELVPVVEDKYGDVMAEITHPLDPYDMQKFRTTLPSMLASYQSFPVSYAMTDTIYPRENHQVFINYRGEDTGHNFVSHLTDAFERHGIKYFVDKNEQRGKDLKNLFVRIEESRIALAIFATRYPESTWCMNELVKMKKLVDEEKLHIIPIFYKVEVSEVAKPNSESEFGRNFWKLVVASDTRDPIQDWREALECISNKMGLSLEDNSSEADFVKKIVKAVERVNEAIILEEQEIMIGKWR